MKALELSDCEMVSGAGFPEGVVALEVSPHIVYPGILFLFVLGYAAVHYTLLNKEMI